MGRFLLIHAALTIVIPFFLSFFGGLWDYVATFVLAGLALALIDRRYGHYLFWSAIFIIYLIKEITVSNLSLAWLIMQPKMKLDPGIIGVPLTVTTGLEITVLSLAIAATPGTLIVDLRQEPSGQCVLYVHTINVGNPDAFRAAIKNGFERMILYISRGATQ